MAQRQLGKMFVRNLNLLSVALSQPLQHGTEAAWQNVCAKLKFAQCCTVAMVATQHRGSILNVFEKFKCSQSSAVAMVVTHIVLSQRLRHSTEAACKMILRNLVNTSLLSNNVLRGVTGAPAPSRHPHCPPQHIIGEQGCVATLSHSSDAFSPVDTPINPDLGLGPHS
jgi:hypothetical protein